MEQNIELQKQLQEQKAKSMKLGEYGVHIYIEATRDLVDSEDQTKTIDPIIKLELMNKIQYSKSKQNIGSEYQHWGDHYFFSHKFSEKEELEQAVIKIQLYDHKLLGRDSLIGSCQATLQQIYIQEQRSLLNIWMCLLNYEDSLNTKIRGYLKLSINVYGEQDTQVILKDQLINGKGSESFDKNNMMMPAQVMTKSYQIKISVVKAEKLPENESVIEKTDAFIEFEIGGITNTTAIISNSINPVWGEILILPYTEPSLNKNLRMKVFDSDIVRNQIIGSNTFPIKQIQDQVYKHYQWINIYASNIKGNKEPYKTIMDNDGKLGSWWRGRVLLKMEMIEQKNPKIEKGVLPEKTMKFFGNTNRELVEYQLNIQLYYGVGFPKNQRYFIKIIWAELEVRVGYPSYIESQNSVYIIYQTRIKTIKLPYQSCSELPDLFIYLVNYNGDHLSYLRKKPSELFSNLIQEPKLEFFKIDYSLSDDLQDFEGGILKMRVAAGIKENMNDLSIGNWNQRMELSQMTLGFKYLIVNVFQAKDLFANDLESSNTYCKVRCYDSEAITSNIEQTFNPIWYQRLVLKVPYFKDKVLPPIIIQLFDKYSIFSADSFVGGCVINQNLVEGTYIPYFEWSSLEMPQPQWFDLHFNSKNKTGQILLSFNYVDNLNEKQIMPDLKIAMKVYQIKINVLGLRGLQSLGMLEVQKAYCRFDVNSMLEQKRKYFIREQKWVETCPLMSGPNPNIQSSIQLEVKLPINIDYFPYLSCCVIDYMFMGAYEQTLGSFNIDFTKKLQSNQQKMDKLLKLATEMKVQDSFKQQQQQQKEKEIQEQSQINIDIDEQIQPLIQVKKDTQDQNNNNDYQKKNNQDADQNNNDDENVKSELDLSQNNINQSKKSFIGTMKLSLGAQFKNIGDKLVNVKDKLVDKIEGVGDNLKNKVFDNSLFGEQHVSKLKQQNFQQLEKNYIDYDIIHPETGKIIYENILIYAQYKMNEKEKQLLEVDIPNPEMYMPLGFDIQQNKTLGKVKKQYRYFVNENLENNEIFVEKLFDEIDIIRQQKSVLQSTFLNTNKLGTQIVGKFKGIIDIQIKETLEAIGKTHQKTLTNYLEEQNKRSSKLLQSQKVVIRLYVLKVTGIVMVDNQTKQDPYLIIKLGDTIINERDNHLNEVTDAEFYKCFELTTELPGTSQLEIEVWDYNMLLSDELIGKTIVDVENRFFSKKWQKLKNNVPIEIRDIYSPLSKLSRGRLSMWLEIMNPQKIMPETIKVAPKPKLNYEIRIVVWEVLDVPSMDVEDVSDLYVTCKIDGYQDQSTDVHYRAQEGKGSFNYRLVYKVKLPLDSSQVIFQIWDKDILSSDEFGGSAVLDLKQFAELAYETDTQQSLRSSDKSFDNKFSLDIIGKDKEDGQTIHKKRNKGTIVLSLDIIPQDQADKNPVGVGQNLPNHSPWLPAPSGRLSYQMGVFNLLSGMVGPKVKRAICFMCCIGVLVSIIMAVLPSIVGFLVGNWINTNIFKTKS